MSYLRSCSGTVRWKHTFEVNLTSKKIIGMFSRLKKLGKLKKKVIKIAYKVGIEDLIKPWLFISYYFDSFYIY